MSRVDRSAGRAPHRRGPSRMSSSASSSGRLTDWPTPKRSVVAGDVKLTVGACSPAYTVLLAAVDVAPRESVTRSVAV